MKKSLIIMSFGLFCLFYNSQVTAQDGQNGIAPVQSVQPALRPVLRRGSFGDEVMRLQVSLTNLGYDTGKPDGDFGPKTEAAVSSFQDDNNMVPSGVVDQATWALLSVMEEDFMPLNPTLPSFAPPAPTAPYSTVEQISKLANSVAFNLIGKTEPEAERIISLVNEILAECGSSTVLQLRVVKENGRDYMVTDDYRVDRLNLTIQDGRIMAIDIG